MKKKFFRLALCLPIVVGAITVAAMAETPTIKQGTGATITPVAATESTPEKLTVTYTGSDLQANKQYAILMVKLNDGVEVNNDLDLTFSTISGKYTINNSTIKYIDQKASPAAGNSISFDVVPNGMPGSVLLLGGDFGTDGPKVLGAVAGDPGPIGGGGATVSGTIKCQESTKGTTTTVSIVDGNGTERGSATVNADGTFSIASVPTGNGYQIRVSKPSYCTYTKKNVDVTGDTNVGEISIELYAGDLNDTDEINGADLALLLADFNKPTAELSTPASDINQSGETNGSDLGLLLACFNHSTLETPAG